MESPNVSKGGFFICKLCGKRFEFVKELVEHKKLPHRNEMRVKVEELSLNNMDTDDEVSIIAIVIRNFTAGEVLPKIKVEEGSKLYSPASNVDTLMESADTRDEKDVKVEDDRPDTLFLGKCSIEQEASHDDIPVAAIPVEMERPAEFQLRIVKLSDSNTTGTSRATATLTPISTKKLVKKEKMTVVREKNRRRRIRKMQVGKKLKLLKHLESQDPELKSYICKECPFTSATLSSLYGHQKCHFRVGKYKCSWCSATFRKTWRRDEHLINFHPQEVDELATVLPSDKAYEGPVQPRSIQLNASVRSEAVEPEGIPVGSGGIDGVIAQIQKCGRCDYKSNSPRHMERHVETIHSEKPRGDFKCPVCLSTFSHPGRLHFHLKFNHASLNGKDKDESDSEVDLEMEDSTVAEVAPDEEQEPIQPIEASEEIVAKPPCHDEMRPEKAFVCTTCNGQFSLLEDLRIHFSSDCEELKTKEKEVVGDGEREILEVTDEEMKRIKAEMVEVMPEVIFVEQVIRYRPHQSS